MRKFDAGKWTADLGAYAWTNRPVYGLCEDHRNRVWVATLGSGLFRYDTDGTVLLGVKFLAEVRRQQQDQTTFYNENSFFIVLHEMAHILQFKRGMAQRTDWQMEPHADFLAGWAYARGSPKAEAWVRDNLELGVRLMFSLGDTAFNDPQHHGQPEFRAAMVRAGFDAADLELDAAFERGMKYAGLR